MNAKQQYDKFIEHVKQSTKKFTLKRSSLKPLFDILDEQLKKNKFAALNDKEVAKKLGTDARLAKYKTPIETLLGVWGTATDYVIPKNVVIPKDSTFSPIAEEDEEDGGGKKGPLTTKEMSCHTWAISGTPANAAKVNRDYTALMNKIGAKYDYGSNLKGKKLPAIRLETMEEILKLCEARAAATDHEVYVCGGFREGQVCPEHLWLEDHTTTKSYDTFIDQDVRVVKKVGEKGKPFKPGCEASAFEATEIARVRLDGYTQGQFKSLPK